MVLSGKQIEVFERVARNMGCKDMKMERATNLELAEKHRIVRVGDVGLAWGRGVGSDGKKCWHGLWASEAQGGLAQMMEFHKDASERQVQQSLLNHALESLEVLRA